MMQRITAYLITAASALIAHGTLAQNCFYSADFEDGNLPAGWSSSEATILSTGEGTPAWTVGNSTAANAGGFFPVPDAPIGNRFAMANDDAVPCDCDMADAVLTLPALDFTARTNVALQCRVFHEATLGGGPAYIEGTVNGSDWTRIDSVEAVAGEWQRLYFDLSGFDGAPAFQLRFRWSDGGAWASGFAVDDLCLSERHLIDPAITRVRIGDATQSPFDVQAASLRYSRLPLEQARAVTVTIELANLGVLPFPASSLFLRLTLDGVEQATFSMPIVDYPDPGERVAFVFTTPWIPNDLGRVEANVHLDPSDPLDGDLANNSASDAILITGPGWEDGYGAMALDAGQVQGAYTSEEGFIATGRFEITNTGSTARGVSAVLATESQEGEFVRAILMDGNFAFIDTSERRAITAEDIDLGWGGGSIYLPFVQENTLAPGEYFAGLQRLPGTGRVGVALSGNCEPGTAAILEGTSFDINWTTSLPMVRLHLNDYGVGLAEHASDHLGNLTVFPQPLATAGTLLLQTAQDDRFILLVRDAAGRVVRETPLGHLASGAHRIDFDAGLLPPGAYLLDAQGTKSRYRGRVIIAR